jgi:hypothetical protein
MFLKKLLNVPILRNILVFGYRVAIVFSEIGYKIKLSIKWLFTSRETTNFTYDLTELNKQYLALTISLITNKSQSEIFSYIKEIDSNNLLKKHIFNETKKSGESYKSDKIIYFGRRIGWYAIVRAIKPKIVVETGVDKGLGSCILISALMKNKEEGYKGYYYGTDINPKAGYLLTREYAKFGEILYGDSISSLKKFNKQIDVFINDSDHSSNYEYKEYLTIRSKLSSNAIILGDNSHCTTKLLEFSKKTNRKFLFFAEVPKNYWRTGAGIGFSYK